MKQNKTKPAKAARAAQTPARRPADSELKRRMQPYRAQIDALDDRLMALLAERFRIIHEVGKLKAAHDFPPYIAERVAEVRERNAKTAKKYGINQDFVRMLYSLIIYQSCAEEETIRAKRKK